jgi:hypothetical protein
LTNWPALVFFARVRLKYRWYKCLEIFRICHWLLKIVVIKNIIWIMMLPIRYDKVVVMINLLSFMLVLSSNDWLLSTREMKDILFWPMFDSQYQQQVLPYELLLFDYRKWRKIRVREREREKGRSQNAIFCVYVRAHVVCTPRSQLVRVEKKENTNKKLISLYGIQSAWCLFLYCFTIVVVVPNIDPSRRHRYRRRRKTELVLVQMFLFLAIVTISRTGNRQINRPENRLESAWCL